MYWDRKSRYASNFLIGSMYESAADPEVVYILLRRWSTMAAVVESFCRFRLHPFFLRDDATGVITA